MSFVLPYVQLTEVKPQGAILPQAPANVPVFLFCSSAGTNFQFVQLGSQQQAAAEVLFGAGPWREGAYIAAKTPVQTGWMKVPATAVSASASAVDHSGVTGTATHFTVGGTILDGYDVVVIFTVGGTFGTSYTYKVSLDGGATFGTPIAVTTSLTMAITGTLNGVSIATGITVTLTTTETVITNDVIKFWTQPASATILPTTITRVNSSTSTLTPSGTPNDKYDFTVIFYTGQGTTGTIGGGGANALSYSYSLDGVTFSDPAAVPLNGVIVLADHRDTSGVTNQTGVTLTCGAGTLDNLDQITFSTTPPVPSAADLQTAMDTVRNTSGAVWSFFYACGSVPVATRNSLETKAQNFAASGRFTDVYLQGRDRITGETVTSSAGNLLGDLAWSGRITATGTDGWGASVGNRTPPSFGYIRITCPLTGRRSRRPFNAQLVSQLLAYTPDTNPGEYDNGPLSADTAIVDKNGQLAEHDGRINPSIFAIGGNVIRTWEGEEGLEAGLWPGDGHLMSASGDITDITQRRVLNLADAALVVAMRGQILQKFGVAPSTARSPLVAGQIFPWDLKRMTQALTQQVVSAVSAYVAGGAGGIFISINPTPQTGGILLVTMQLNGKQYVRGFQASAGFVNPALFGLVTPAA
jgi:hypothetical protein